LEEGGKLISVMRENKNNEGSNNLIKIFLILLSVLVFSYLFVLVMNEIINILIHFILGRLEFELYLHLFEWSYTSFANPIPDPFRGGLGPLINLIISACVFLIFWGKRNQYIIVLYSWASTILLLEAYGIFFGTWNSLIAQVVPSPISTSIGISFFFVGILLILVIRAIIYDSNKIPFWKLGIINFTTLPFFQIITVFYHGAFNLLGILPILFTSIIATIVTFIEKPLFPILNRITKSRRKTLKWSAVGFNINLANIIMLIYIFSPYNPPSEKSFIANLITFSVIISIFIIEAFIILPKFALIRKELKKFRKIDFIIEPKIKIEDLDLIRDMVTLEMEIDNPKKMIIIEGVPDAKNIAGEEKIEEVKVQIEKEFDLKADIPEEKKEEQVSLKDQVSSEKLIGLEKKLESQEVTEERIVEIEQEPIEEFILSEMEPIVEEIDYKKEDISKADTFKVKEEIIEDQVLLEDKVPNKKLIDLEENLESQVVTNKKDIGFEQEPIGEFILSEEESIAKEIDYKKAKIQKADGFKTKEELIEEIKELSNIPIEENREQIELEQYRLEKENEIKKFKLLELGNLICDYCGFKNKDDANYCLQCGQSIKTRN
jgi:hypothetical protein